MLAKKFKRLEGSKANVVSQAAAGAQMNHRDPGMLRIPNDRWDRANNKTSEQPVQTRPFEFLAEPGRQSENEQGAHDFQGVDPATQKSKADQQSGQRPVERKLRTLFNGEPKGKHRRHPKKDR